MLFQLMPIKTSEVHVHEPNATTARFYFCVEAPRALRQPNHSLSTLKRYRTFLTSRRCQACMLVLRVLCDSLVLQRSCSVVGCFWDSSLPSGSVYSQALSDFQSEHLFARRVTQPL